MKIGDAPRTGWKNPCLRAMDPVPVGKDEDWRTLPKMIGEKDEKGWF